MSRSRLPRLLALALLLAPLAACGGEPHILAQLPLPPVADLTVEPKPPFPDAAITDDAVSAQYGSDVEAWGERGWASVARLCRWAAANKMVHPTCPVTP